MDYVIEIQTIFRKIIIKTIKQWSDALSTSTTMYSFLSQIYYVIKLIVLYN